MHRNSVAFVLGASLLLALGAGEYRNDLSGSAPGVPPKEFQAVGGAFKVVEVGADKMLELPGEPLDVFGLLYGPAEHAELDARAKCWGEASGRRYPEFGVGLGDVGGYRLMVLPVQERIELRRGDDVLKSVDVTEPWRSGAWTWVRLRLSKAGDGKWAVEGKAWPATGAEPQAWQVSHELTEAPSPGRASVWGVPFSGKPIRFDDLTAQPVPAAKP